MKPTLIDYLLISALLLALPASVVVYTTRPEITQGGVYHAARGAKIAPHVDPLTFKTRISIYNPSRSNTTGDTLMTASGSRIDPKHPARWLAVCSEWLEFFPYGVTVYISCPEAPYINGPWVVKDTGCKEGIDLLISNPVSCRIEFCLTGFISNQPIK